MSKNFWKEQKKHEQNHKVETRKMKLAYAVLLEEIEKIKSTPAPVENRSVSPWTRVYKVSPTVKVSDEVEAKISSMKSETEKEAPLFYPVVFERMTGSKSVARFTIGGRP